MQAKLNTVQLGENRLLEDNENIATSELASSLECGDLSPLWHYSNEANESYCLF